MHLGIAAVLSGREFISGVELPDGVLVRRGNELCATSELG